MSRHTDGSKNKSSSYDFAGVGERLCTGPNSRAIQSALMPATVRPPRKPTTKEFEAQIRSKDKEIDKLGNKIRNFERKHQRHHDMFATKLKMKDESVQNLKRLLERKKAQVVDLSNQLKEEKRSHRVTLGLLRSIEKRADDTSHELRGLQSDLIAVKECTDQTLNEAKEEHRKEMSELSSSLKHERKRAVQAERRAAMKKSKAKLDKAHETHSMAQKNLQKLLDQYKAESKQHYPDSIESLKSVEKSVRAKLDLIEQEHISDVNEVKCASRLRLQDQVNQLFYVTLHCTKV